MWNQHSLQILGIKFCVFKFHKDFYSQVFNLAIFFFLQLWKTQNWVPQGTYQDMSRVIEHLEQNDWSKCLQKVTCAKRIDLAKITVNLLRSCKMSWDCPTYMSYKSLRLLASFVFCLTSPKLHLASLHKLCIYRISSYLVAITWNKVSDTLRSLSTLSTFEKSVRQLRF